MANASPSPPPPAAEFISGHSVEINPNLNKTAIVSSIDDIVERYMSNTSLIFPILASFSWIFDSQQTFINVFSDSQPPWRCTSAACNLTATHSTPCNLPSSSWSFTKPRHISTISDLHLECASPAQLALPASCFYAGCLAGGLLLATLADSKLGRKNTLALSLFTMSLTAGLTAVSPNLAVYAALRFACGFARANVGTTAFVLSSELVPARQRNHANILTFIFSNAGFLTLPAISFLNRASSWRLLYLYTSVPSLFYSIFLYFYMEESPRWLLVKGKKKEAFETLGKLSSLEEAASLSDMVVACPEKTESGGSSSAPRMLWERRWAMQRLVAIMIVSFGVGIMYYGMPLNLENLNANLYISVVMNAVTELPSGLLIVFLGNVLSRRISLIVLMVVSGGCSVACTAVGGWLALVAELVAFAGAFTAFCIVMMYIVELFPTCVRNTTTAVVRQAVVLGGVVAPALVVAGRRRRFLSFGVFGIVMIVCGLFTVFLPETKGCVISDTMEEEEKEDDGVKECHQPISMISAGLGLVWPGML